MRPAPRLRSVALLLTFALSVATVAPVSAAQQEAASCCGSGECSMAATAMQCCAPAPVAPDSSATPAGQPTKGAKPDTQPTALLAAPAPSPGPVSDPVRAAFDLELLRLPHDPPYLLNSVFRI